MFFLRKKFTITFLLLSIISSKLSAKTVSVEDVVLNYQNLVFVSYEASLSDAQKLDKAIHVFLNTPSEKNLNLARYAWKNARASYMQTEAFRFYEGPIDYVENETGEEGPEGRINAWPLNENFIDYVKGQPKSGLIFNTSVLITKETIKGKDQVSDEADVTTGFHAIEFLLWGQDFSDSQPGQRSFKDFVGSNEIIKRRGQYLKEVSALLVEDLDFLVNAWHLENSEGYGVVFTEANVKESLENIFRGIITLAEYELAYERFKTALSSGDQEDEQSCFSDTTYYDFLHDIKGIQNVYYGDAFSHTGVGLDQLIRQKDPKLAQEMGEQLNKTYSLFYKIDQPFDLFLKNINNKENKDKSKEAFEALIELGDILKKAAKLFDITIRTESHV